MAELLALLIEVERRRLHLALGHSSLFVYCVRVLHLSEQAAYSRITGARAARRYPELLPLLAQGALTLSSVERLAPHLTDDTVEPLLEAARFKSTREVERLIAGLCPRPDIPASVRAVPMPASEAPRVTPLALEGSAPTLSEPITPEPEPAPRPILAPLSPRRYYLKLTIGQETHDTLERLRALLRHSVPDGDLATIVERALTLLLQDTERTKCASTSKARATTGTKSTGRYVPAAVRRAVWSRDGARCAFVGSDGRCGESAFLEFHHVVPFAAGSWRTDDDRESRTTVPGAQRLRGGAPVRTLVNSARAEWPERPTIDQPPMRLAVALLACVVGLGAQTSAPPQTQKTGTASITGRVIASDTGAIVRAAAVWLMTPADSWTTTTDPDGRFTFPQLAAAEYTLKVMKPGFVPTEFGDPKSSEFGGVDPIRIADGLKVNRGDLALPRGGVIAGRIVDAFGDPVETTVTILRRQFVAPGLPRLVSVQGVRSNDLGEFRIYGLMPGTYYLGAGIHAMPTGAVSPGREQPRLVASRWGVAPTLYPGTSMAADALPITITPGQDISGITMALQSVALAKVSGSVTTTAGTRAAGFFITADPIRPDAVSVMLWNQAQTDESGQFTLANLPPGEYRLNVQARSTLEMFQTSGVNTLEYRPRVPSEFASVPVTIAGQDLEGLDISLTNGHEVRGRVVTEGDVPLPPGPLLVHSGMTSVHEGRSGMTLQAQTSVGLDGTFVLKGVVGPRLIRVAGFPAPWTLKHVRTPAGDITEEGVDVRGDIHGLEILLTPKATRIDGTAKDANGFPIRDCLVVVFPTDARRWMLPGARSVRSAPVDSDGDFSFRDLPPGNYFAAPISRAHDATWMDPDFLERLKAVATPFTLGEGETKTLALVRKR